MDHWQSCIILHLCLWTSDQLQIIVSKIPASESLVLLGDWNGHVVKATGAYPNVHCGFGYGTCNTDGERIFEFARGVSTDMIRETLCKMKGGKAAGPSGIIAEMMKAWGDEGLGKFRKLLPILTSRHISLPVREKAFSSYVRSAMVQWW